MAAPVKFAQFLGSDSKNLAFEFLLSNFCFKVFMLLFKLSYLT